MINGKKIVAISLLAAMSATLFTGCKKTRTAEEEFVDGKYVPGEKMELTVWDTQGTDSSTPQCAKLENDLVGQWLLDKTNVRVENWYGNDGGQWDTKLSKLVAADNMPDIVHCNAGQGPAHFAKLAQLNQVWELTPEMLEKYAPEVLRRTPKEAWEQIKVDGKIYGIPYNYPYNKEAYPDMTDDDFNFIKNTYQNSANDMTFDSSNCFYIRDDILKQFYPQAKSYQELCDMMDKDGVVKGEDLLDIPIKTTQEYIDFMYKLKDANLTENGKKIYPFGYTGSDNWTALTYLGGDMYGYKGHQYTSTWREDKQAIEIPLAHDLVKQAAKTQNQMVADGVIDPESLVHTAEQYKQKVLNGQYVFGPINACGMMIHDINKELEASGATFRYRPFITQVAHPTEYPAFKQADTWIESLCITKAVSETELHQILNWINTQYTDEFEQVRYWGPKEANMYEETTDANGKVVRKFTAENDAWNQYFLEGKTDVLKTDDDRKGIGGFGGMMIVSPCRDYSSWSPVVMYHKANLYPEFGSGFKFLADSEHVKNVKVFPSCYAYNAEYGDLPEVVSYWGEREQWESKFKMAIAATPTEFETKWTDALTTLNGIVPVEQLESAMTAVAKPLAEKIK